VRKKVLAAVAVVVLLIAGVATAAWASIPDSNGVIHGCRKNTDGWAMCMAAPSA
jgi:hypothetical protein